MKKLFSALNSLQTNIFGGGNHVGANPPGSTTPILRKSAIEMADRSPTSRLDNDPLAFSSISYPRDLTNDMTNGHYMLFYINVQNKTKFQYTGYDKDGKKVSVGGKTVKTRTENYDYVYDTGTNKTIGYKAGEEIITDTGGSGIPNYAESQSIKERRTFDYSDEVQLSKQGRKAKTGIRSNFLTTTRISDSIALYLPPNVQDKLSQNYGPAATGVLGFLAASGGKFLDSMKRNDFTGAASILLGTGGGVLEEILKNVGSSVVETITQSEGGYEMLNQVFGRAANPYMEVFYDGTSLRTFTYNFTFAPKNEDERDDVQKIITMFRFHSSPELRTDHNMFLGLPSEFDIHYMYQNSDGKATENDFYHKIATCVLQDVTTDFTPGGVYSHADGSPVKITMSLTFTETEIITKDHIDEGF